MPGIIGYAGTVHCGRPQQLLDAMAMALREESWYRVDVVAEEGYGLGRVSLGLLNRSAQPVSNEDGTVSLVMDGELYGCEALKQGLVAKGHHLRSDDDAELVLHQYEELGEAFANRLNGAFAVAVWDGRAHKLVIANDRIGLVPVYYAQSNEGLIFGSGVRALLADPNLRREVDLLAIAQFLTFQHVLGDRTLLSSVHFLEPSSILVYRDGQLSLRHYWAISYPEVHEPRSEQSYAEELIQHVRRAVARRAGGDAPLGILLSGGLDSRVLFACLNDSPARQRLRTFTWGIPNCDDARFARAVARRAGIANLFYELRPDFLLQSADRCVRLTDGLGSCINLHALATLEEETQSSNIIFKGFMGDGLMGYGLSLLLWGNPDASHAAEWQYAIYAGQEYLGFPISEHGQLFSAAFSQQLGNGVLDSFGAAVSEAGTAQPALQRHHFHLRHRLPRMTHHGVEVMRSRAVVRVPYCDNDLVEFVLTVPPGLLYDRHLMKTAFIQAFPQLAKLPYTETGLPMMACLRDSLMRLDRQVRWRLHGVGVGFVQPYAKRPYADYNRWFRTVLRNWVCDLLLSERSLQRGYFNPDQVRRLVDEHMAGAKHAMKLGGLLTIELWHRQFMDAPAATRAAETVVSSRQPVYG